MPERQTSIGIPQASAFRASVELTLALATVLPPILVGLTAGARLTVPTSLCRYFDLATLACVGVLTYIGASWALVTRLRHAKRPWLLTLVLYDLAMPLVLFGVVLLADARIPCR